MSLPYNPEQLTEVRCWILNIEFWIMHCTILYSKFYILHLTSVRCSVWASALSLAATHAILISLFSSRYWNVLLPWVRVLRLRSGQIGFTNLGFPIRRSPDQKLLGTSPELIAATLRPSSPARSQGIHHTLLNFPLGNLKTTFSFLLSLTLLTTK